ncbi:MAG: MFS transporter [Promethearchaeota archaeon]
MIKKLVKNRIKVRRRAEKTLKNYRDLEDIEKLRRRNFYALLVSFIFYGFGQSMFNIVYGPFILEFTGSIFLTGVIITAGNIVQFLPMPWLGRLSDRYGRRFMWFFDTPFMIVGLIFLIIANNLYILITGALCFHFGIAIALSVYLVFVSENSTENKKGFNYGIFAFVQFGSSIAGSYFILVDSRFNAEFYFLIFIVILLITYVNFLLFIFDPIPRKSKFYINPGKSTQIEKGIWGKIFTTPKLRAVVIFFTLDAFIYSISLSIYSAGLIDQYKITKQDIALLTLSSNISLMLLQIPAGHLTDKIGKKKSLILCESFGITFFATLIMTFFLWSNGFEGTLLPLLILGQVINAVVATTFIPSEGIALTNLDETRRAESYGIVSLIRGIGIIPTGVIAGFLIQSVHYITPFIFTIIGIIFLIWFLSKNFESDIRNNGDNIENA